MPGGRGGLVLVQAVIHSKLREKIVGQALHLAYHLSSALEFWIIAAHEMLGNVPNIGDFYL